MARRRISFSRALMAVLPLSVLLAALVAKIAVVDNLKTLRFLGCIHERDVMAAYNLALIESRREERE